MKQKDIALIIAVAGFSTVVAFILASLLFGSPKNRQQEVLAVEPISSGFENPSEKYFNSTSINPTQTIQIGDTNNPEPFVQ